MNKKLKPIPGFPDYFIDKQSNVYSMKPVGKNQTFPGRIPNTPKLLKPGIDSGNYLTVSLRKDNKFITKRIAVLMLETFVSPRPKGWYACHGKRGSLNNRLDNVYWGSPTQNNMDKHRDGTMPNTKGERSFFAKLNEWQIRVIRKAYSPKGKNGLSALSLSEIFNVSPVHICGIAHYRTWRHI